MVRRLFNTELERIGYKGVIGVAGFKNAYHELARALVEGKLSIVSSFYPLNDEK